MFLNVQNRRVDTFSCVVNILKYISRFALCEYDWNHPPFVEFHPGCTIGFNTEKPVCLTQVFYTWLCLPGKSNLFISVVALLSLSSKPTFTDVSAVSCVYHPFWLKTGAGCSSLTGLKIWGLSRNCFTPYHLSDVKADFNQSWGSKVESNLTGGTLAPNQCL